MVRRPPHLLFVPAHVLPLIHPRPSLVTIHDLGYRHFPEAHPRLQRLYLNLSTRWNARVAQHILADSQATKADLVEMYDTPPEKITVAYPGYDTSLAPVRDESALAAAKRRYGIHGEYFLHLGTLQPRKNLARLIEAFAAAEVEATLVLAGPRGWLYEELFARVRRLGMERRVLFPGYVAGEDKAALISGARAFVFPSLHEGFGLPVLEAQACGCPVLCADRSSLPEVAGEGALRVDPLDTAALAEGMRRLASDAELRKDLVERGTANLRRFSWARCARQVLQAMSRMLEQDPASVTRDR